MSQSLFNLIIAIFYIAAGVGVTMFFSWFAIVQRKHRYEAKQNIAKKLGDGISLSARDVVSIGRSYGLNPQQSRNAVYRIYGDAHDKESFESLKILVEEIEREEPFDDVPEETRPSLERLNQLALASSEAQDKHIMLPVIKSLAQYNEQKAEQERLKKQTHRAYFVSLISFLVGAVSFYFTVTAPSAQEIAKALQAKKAAVSQSQSQNPGRETKTSDP